MRRWALRALLAVGLLLSEGVIEQLSPHLEHRVPRSTPHPSNSTPTLLDHHHPRRRLLKKIGCPPGLKYCRDLKKTKEEQAEAEAKENEAWAERRAEDAAHRAKVPQSSQALHSPIKTGLSCAPSRCR